MFINKQIIKGTLHNVLHNGILWSVLLILKNYINEMQIREGLQHRISTKSVEGFMEHVSNLDHGKT
jgi:hypothetical protein